MAWAKMVIFEQRSGAYSIVHEHRSTENFHLRPNLTTLQKVLSKAS